MFSQFEDQKGNIPPVHANPQEKELTLLTDVGFRKLISFATIFVLILGSVQCFGVLPEAERTKVQRELAQGKVLEALLGEVKLLRLAVERLSDQQ